MPGTGRRVPARGAAGPRGARARAGPRRHRRSPPAGPEDELHPGRHRPPGLTHGRGAACPIRVPTRRASGPPAQVELPSGLLQLRASAVIGAADGCAAGARAADRAGRPSPAPAIGRCVAAAGRRLPTRRAGDRGQFGAGFARAVASARAGRVAGADRVGVRPAPGAGTARESGRPRAFEEVRAQLLDEWRREKEAAAKNAYFAGLLEKYDMQATAGAQPLLGPALAMLRGDGA